ncbi:hypothetical protein K501DRAFT_273069 [Backusella circina FSU 941]|nr:hypothetical protein K501DRAFT_273069 [Backusella circina FSU 941]
MIVSIGTYQFDLYDLLSKMSRGRLLNYENVSTAVNTTPGFKLLTTTVFQLSLLFVDGRLYISFSCVLTLIEASDSKSVSVCSGSIFSTFFLYTVSCYHSSKLKIILVSEKEISSWIEVLISNCFVCFFLKKRLECFSDVGLYSHWSTNIDPYYIRNVKQTYARMIVKVSYYSTDFAVQDRMVLISTCVSASSTTKYLLLEIVSFESSSGIDPKIKKKKRKGYIKRRMLICILLDVLIVFKCSTIRGEYYNAFYVLRSSQEISWSGGFIKLCCMVVVFLLIIPPFANVLCLTKHVYNLLVSNMVALLW